MTSPLSEIDDPGEYNQRRRIRAIHDARERVFEQRRRGLDLRARGVIGQRQYRDILRESVESFILEIEQLLRRYQADAEPNLDADSDVPPPPWYLEDVDLGIMRLPPDAQELVFDGLLSVVEAPDPFVREWEERPDAPAGFEGHPLAKTETKHREIQIREGILLNAVRAGMQFLGDVGLDVEMGDGVRDAGFDYSDILDEGPPKNNAPQLEVDGGSGNPEDGGE